MTGVVVWFTGLPASGKTTLANRVQSRLASRAPCVILDSDVLRGILRADAYDRGARDDFYRIAGELAGMLARQGLVVLVAATAPSRAHRAQARTAAPRFVEVWVRTSLEECERRDVKKLYARARSGELSTLPGLGVTYEPPLAPDVTAAGGHDELAVTAILQRIDRSPSHILGAEP